MIRTVNSNRHPRPGNRRVVHVEDEVFPDGLEMPRINEGEVAYLDRCRFGGDLIVWAEDYRNDRVSVRKCSFAPGARLRLLKRKIDLRWGDRS